MSAQSWTGLAGDDDERYRIAASADGGIWLLRTPHPEPVTGLAGMRKLTDTTRRLLGVPVWGHQGTSRIRQAPVADPALIRSLDVGQVGYIYRGGVTYVQVKRLIGGPAALPGPGRAAAPGRTAAGPLAAVPPAGGPAADGQATASRAANGPAADGQAADGQAGRVPPDPPPPRQLPPDVSGFLDDVFGPEAGR